MKLGNVLLTFQVTAINTSSSKRRLEYGCKLIYGLKLERKKERESERTRKCLGRIFLWGEDEKVFLKNTIIKN